jgi:hypothetical protein
MAPWCGPGSNAGRARDGLLVFSGVDNTSLLVRPIGQFQIALVMGPVCSAPVVRNSFGKCKSTRGASTMAKKGEKKAKRGEAKAPHPFSSFLKKNIRVDYLISFYF